MSDENLDPLLSVLRGLHGSLRDRVLEACEAQDSSALSEVAAEDAADTIYAVDRVSEHELLAWLEPRARALGGIALVAEGIEGGARTLPDGLSESSARYRVIVDPIDGTRGLMYQKRSAWILTAVAPNHGPETRLSDVTLAIQTEIPLIKQHLSDQVWAIRGHGVRAERRDRIRGVSCELRLRPSPASHLEHGFATFVRFFPGLRDAIGALDEEVLGEVLGQPPAGKAVSFEDQYICTGGQLYELMCGHDRFVADLRPVLAPLFRARGQEPGLCCHPYDICTALIASELGVIVTDARGAPLDVPLDVTSPVAWCGYANARIHDQIAPVLEHALRRRGLI